MDVHEGSPEVALSELLAHRGWVQAVARRLATAECEADDIEQETWVAAIRTPPAHRRSIRGWLFAVATNVARRLNRSRARRATYESRPRVTGPCDSPAELASRADAHRRLVEAVVQLGEPLRQTVLLRYFEGLELREVSERMGVPYETVRKRLRRAVGALRTRLEVEQQTRHSSLAVLLTAVLQPPPTSAAAGLGLATGGVVMGLKIKIGLVAVVLVAGLSAWILLDPEGSRTSAPSEPPARNDVAATAAPSTTESPAQDEPGSPTRPPEASVESVEKSLGRTLRGLAWRGQALKQVLAELSGASGVKIVLTAKAAREIEEQKKTVALELRAPMPASEVLSLIVMMNGLAWTTEGSRVVVSVRGEKPAKGGDVVIVPPAAVEAPELVAVKGVVVDEVGTGIARAEIWFVDRGRYRLASTCDADGRFRFEIAPPCPRILARTPGRIPSRLIEAEESSPLRIVVGGAAARVTGVVRDAEGRPMGDVRVKTTGSPERTPAFRTRSDAEGRFTDASAPPGPVTVRVSRSGYRPECLRLELRAGETRELAITLRQGVVVLGTLRDDRGAPVAGGVIQVLGPGETALAIVNTGPDGTFRIGGLPDVPLGLRAEASGFLTVKKSLADPVAENRWDPVVQRGLGIEGTLVDEDGEPLTGYRVRSLRGAFRDILGDEHPSQTAIEVRTGEDGRFSVGGLDATPYRVGVIPPTQGLPVLIVDGVVPGTSPPLRLRVRTPDLPAAGLTGVVFDPEGKPLEGARVEVRQANSGLSVVARVDGEGRFTTALVPPGEYLARIWVPGLGTRHVGPVRVTGSRHADLGQVRFQTPGRLTAGIRKNDIGVKFLYLEVLRSAAGDRWHTEVCLVIRGGADTAHVLSPGRYLLLTRGPGVARTSREVEIRTGQASAVGLNLEPVPESTLNLTLPAGVATRAGRIEIRTSAGILVARVVASADQPAHELTLKKMRLKPGAYRLRAEVAGGASLEGTFQIRAGDPSPVVVPLE